MEQPGIGYVCLCLDFTDPSTWSGSTDCADNQVCFDNGDGTGTCTNNAGSCLDPQVDSTTNHVPNCTPDACTANGNSDPACVDNNRQCTVTGIASYECASTCLSAFPYSCNAGSACFVSPPVCGDV